MRRYAIPIAAGLAVFCAAACSPDEGDFKNDAEGFIEDDDGEVESQIGVALSDATCEDPASTDVGTTFTCTAVGDDGTTYDFTVEITGDNSYQVGGGTPAGGSAPPGTGATTVPATTTG
jgi:Domain of unknown function (DUF4333)